MNFRPCFLLSLWLWVGAVIAKPVPADSLPAGTVITLNIAVPGDATPNRIRYTVPAPAVKPVPVKPAPVVVTPVPVPVATGLSVLNSVPDQSGQVGSFYSYTIPMGTFGGPVRGVDVSDLPPGIRYDSQSRTLSGTPTTADSRTITVTASDGSRIVQTRFVLRFTAGDAVQSAPKPQSPSGGSALLQNSRVNFSFAPQPNRVNRLQAPVLAPYADGWKMKQSEIITGGNGGLTETPDELRLRGHNWFAAQWFYGDNGRASWGYPKATDNLFFEYTGGFWAPYHQDAYASLVDDLQTIGDNCVLRLPIWNSVPENGLIDGVATVKEGHFNLEYGWFTDEVWNRLSAEQRNRRFFNYQTGQYETVQQCYDRAGLDGLLQAQHQKWRNIIALSVLYLNANNNGMKAHYGDMWGLSRYHNLAAWNDVLSPVGLLTNDVNNAGLYPEANESANAGRITLRNGQSFDVSGNLNQMQGRRNVYNYEWAVSMTRDDYNAFFSIGPNAPADQKNINNWYVRIKPNLTRPYDMAYHILLNRSIANRKGWTDFKFYWQAETIYEHSLLVDGQEVNGAWVPWTIQGGAIGRPTKIPLHPEVVANMTYLARMHYDGKFTWGSSTRINPDAGVGENVNPSVHLVSREAEQDALSELGQYNETVFTADKRQHLADVPVLNPATGQYVAGGPAALLLANGDANNPVALVTGVDSPSTGWELYFVYYPNASRDGKTTVRFRSPVDGAELSAEATGWGGKLYARKR